MAVPDPDWARAIRAAARARAPARPADFGCTLAAIARTESAWNPKAVSPVGAGGLMQMMPGTAKDMGVKDRFDPAQSIRGGARYYAWLYRQWRAYERTPEQRRPLALAGYNHGLGSVLRVQRREGCIQAPCFYPFLPSETRDYLWRIDHLRRTGDWSPHPPDGWLP